MCVENWQHSRPGMAEKNVCPNPPNPVGKRIPTDYISVISLVTTSSNPSIALPINQSTGVMR